MDDLITVFLSSGKKVTGGLSEDFFFLSQKSVGNYELDHIIMDLGKEVIIAERVEFVRAATEEETNYYNTHHITKKVK